jgi:ribosomal protein S13
MHSGFDLGTVLCLSADLQRRIVAQNIKRLKDIGCYRGRRHIMVSS